jgi:hypothetical protein
MRIRCGKQPVSFPMLAIAAWLSMPALAAEGQFAISSDFLSAELTTNRGLPGSDLQNLKHMAPQTLDQLMAAARGQLPLNRKMPLQPMILNPQKPMIYVSGPKTKGQWTAVIMDDLKAREHEEQEILREAEAALKMDLPDPVPGPMPIKKLAPVMPATRLVETRVSSFPPVAAQHSGGQLQLVDVGNELRISPKKLQINMQDDGIVVIDKNLQGSPQIFLRNPNIVRWDVKKKTLEARDLGRTELFISYRDQLYIVPIEVRGGQHRDPLLAETPGSFQKLTSVMPLMDQPYASYSETSGQDSPQTIAVAQEKARPSLTLATSVAQVQATRERVVQQQASFFYPDANPNYRTVDIQVLDERSSPEMAEIFPVSGVSVRILGTNLKASTTREGHAKFGEIPEGSRFYVEIQDEENGQIVPTVSEVALYRGSKDQVLRTRTMNYRSYSSYLNILDLAQDSSKASLCARVMSEDGSQPLADYRVQMKDANADGPFYVGVLGAPDRTLKSTGPGGRFCFFNVNPGLAELSFETGAQFRTSLAMPLFAGAHSEEDLPLSRDDGGRVFLAAMPSAVDQIYEEKQAIEQPFQPVEFVDMVAVGENEILTKTSNSVLSYEAGSTLFKGRLYTLAKAPEFETSLYSFDRDKEYTRSIPVAPLLQRGYVQDVFHELAEHDNYTSIALDPALGSAIVLHRLESGLGQVNVTLIDGDGQVHNQGWSFGNPEQGLSRTIFFNLSPGLYSVKVENLQGAIQSLDTIAVDYWTASISQTGSTPHFNLQQNRRED